MKLAVYNPNLSVILPVACNAKCEFCYWKKQKGLDVARFDFVANSLPKDLFKQCSITGGEPTMLPNLLKYLKIAKDRFDKVVLNTNGHKLTLEHLKAVDYVNISRHHYLDLENEKVFKTKRVPTAKELKELCARGNVTLNCFLPSDFKDKKFIMDYVSFAKELGAAGVAFRKYYENLDVLSEVDTNETLVKSHNCGACLHRSHLINDMEVVFKYSVKETFEHVSGVYELVLHPNGDLCFDWGGKNKLEYNYVDI